MIIFGLIGHFEYRSDIVFYTHLTEYGGFLCKVSDTCLRPFVYWKLGYLKVVEEDSSFIRSDQSYGKLGEVVTDSKPRVWVLDFKGSMDAHEVNSLREEITAVLAAFKPQDQVVLRLESPGGMVHGYGLAASQLQRLRDKNIPLTVTVDKVAASGGYMMACVADKIVSAPFAIVGSIGVVAQMPNFNRFLKSKDIDIFR